MAPDSASPHTRPSLLAPDEGAPFEVLNGDAGGRLLLVCDHAANRVPRALGDLGLAHTDLLRHIGWDIGAAAVTRAPGWTFCRPSTTMRSPGVSPAVTSQSLPTARSVSMACGATRLSPSRSHTRALPSAERNTACCGTRMASSRTPCSTRARTNMPGSSSERGLGTTARSSTVLVSGSTVTSENSSSPFSA